MADVVERPNEGVAPPDFTTAVGQVRLLTMDTDAEDIDGRLGVYVLASDTEIRAYLTLYKDNPKRVAIKLLRMTALTTAVRLKKFGTADLSVDGPSIAKEIREAADDLERELLAEEENEGAAGFSIVPTGGRYPDVPDDIRVAYGDRLYSEFIV